MKEKEFIKWSKTRRIGKLKFTLLCGLYYCIMANVVMLVYEVIRHEFMFDIGNILIKIIFFGGCGVFVSTMLWKNYELKYIDYLNKQNKN